MSILSILEPANATTVRPTTVRLTNGSIPPRSARTCWSRWPMGPRDGLRELRPRPSAPCLESVRAAVEAALPSYASVHRGNGYASGFTTQWYERARAEVHEFVGARADDQVIFTRQTPTPSTCWLVRVRPTRP